MYITPHNTALNQAVRLRLTLVRYHMFYLVHDYLHVSRSVDVSASIYLCSINVPASFRLAVF